MLLCYIVVSLSVIPLKRISGTKVKNWLKVYKKYKNRKYKKRKKKGIKTENKKEEEN